MPTYKATAYIRLSYTDDRSSESDSVANQRKLIENFVERNPDIEVVSYKVDDGYSGIIFDRPAFKEMMQDVTNGEINCVIVKDLSRLGREYIETGRYLRRVFPAYGVRFIAITDNIDTAQESSGDDLTVSVKNIMNEAYCRDISVKTRTSLDVKRRNGDFVGAFTVYGYIKSEDNKNLLVPDPYASRVVQNIFQMRLEGSSALRIANELNRLGILSPLAYKKNHGLPYAKKGYADREDCKWSATTIIRMLQDETYTGTLVQGKQGTSNYKIKQMEQKPESEWIRIPDAHEPLITKQDFDLVQRIRGLDTRTSPKQDTVYLFSGVLICGCCGSRMTRKTNRVNGKEYHYYYCPTGKKHGCANPVMLKESKLIDCVQESLKAYIQNVASLETLLNSIDQSSINQALAKEYTAHISENERRLEQAQETVRRFSQPHKKQRDYLLKGIVFCGCCDHALSYVANKRPYFHCRRSQAYETGPCHDLKLDAKELEQVIWGTLKAQLETVLSIGADGSICLDAVAAEPTEYKKQIEALEDSKQSLFDSMSWARLMWKPTRPKKQPVTQPS